MNHIKGLMPSTTSSVSVQVCEIGRREAEAAAAAHERLIEHLQMTAADAQAQAVHVLERQGELAAAYHPLVQRLRQAEDAAADAEKAAASASRRAEDAEQRASGLAGTHSAVQARSHDKAENAAQLITRVCTSPCSDSIASVQTPS
jgi:chromosome segregation ATPase